MLPLLILAVKFSGFTEALQGSSTPWECIEYWERGEKQHLLLDSSFPPGEPLFISNRKEPEVKYSWWVSHKIAKQGGSTYLCHSFPTSVCWGHQDSMSK